MARLNVPSRTMCLFRCLTMRLPGEENVMQLESATEKGQESNSIIIIGSGTAHSGIPLIKIRSKSFPLDFPNLPCMCQKLLGMSFWGYPLLRKGSLI